MEELDHSFQLKMSSTLHDQFLLPDRVRGREMLGRGGGVLGGDEGFHGQSQQFRHGQIRAGIEHDAAVHENVFVVASGMVLRTGRDGEEGGKDGEDDPFHRVIS